ncbi:WXG100 family type VII secretion target [Micromonospora sp. Llam7]|uniref:WXG100 family type VII secretion target n=1 Tax=Micromonospora tarapacensis TaxID=2835305 RepID=UPI001C834D67|nr:WXG100 family type VII secretion target [Micromonospora tarapacensis]
MAIDYDASTTTALTSAFNNAVVKQDQAFGVVESCESALPWHGMAAAEYRNALARWREGLRKVRLALDEIDEKIRQNAQQSQQADDDALVDAQRLTAKASWT